MIGRRTLTAFAALLLVVLASCTRAPQISTEAAGHAITARIQGTGTKVESSADRAQLSSEFGSVTIERVRMRVEGSEWIRIVEGVPVTVGIERGRIGLRAGGVKVSRNLSE